MKQFWHIVAASMLFSGVLLLGSLAPARAQMVPPGTVLPPTNPLPPGQIYQVPPSYFATAAYIQYRWQVITVPGPTPNCGVVILLDTQLGSSYILRPDREQPSGFSWQLLDLQR